MHRDELVIGFDLDMTLIDSRRAVHAGLTAFAAGEPRPERRRTAAGARAQAYVGDVAAANAAEVIMVGVATGATTPAELRAASDDVLRPDLFALPPWLAGLEETIQERTHQS